MYGQLYCYFKLKTNIIKYILLDYIDKDYINNGLKRGKSK